MIDELATFMVTGTVARSARRKYRVSYDRSAEIGGRPFEFYRVPS